MIAVCSRSSALASLKPEVTGYTSGKPGLVWSHPVGSDHSLRLSRVTPASAGCHGRSGLTCMPSNIGRSRFSYVGSFNDVLGNSTADGNQERSNLPLG